MIIKKATRQEYKEISLIFKREYGKNPYHEKWTEESAFEKIKEYSHQNSILIAEKEKTIMGFIIFSEFLWDDGPRIFIDELVIKEKFQKQGLGRKLIQEVEDFFKNKGKVGITLLAHKEAKAIEFYKKLGFNEGKLILWDKKLS